MIWWAAYDISNPKRLRNVAKLCQCAGLVRIQKSIYAGELSQTQVMLLREELLRWVKPDADRMLMFPLSERCVRSAISLGEDCEIAELSKHKAVMCV